METLDDFWDAVSGPCVLPPWFGRNVAAWRDTIQARGISDLVDRHDVLIVHVDRTGFFARDDREVRNVKSAFAGRRSRLVIHEPDRPTSGT